MHFIEYEFPEISLELWKPKPGFKWRRDRAFLKRLSKLQTIQKLCPWKRHRRRRLNDLNAEIKRLIDESSTLIELRGTILHTIDILKWYERMGCLLSRLQDLTQRIKRWRGVASTFRGPNWLHVHHIRKYNGKFTSESLYDPIQEIERLIDDFPKSFHVDELILELDRYTTKPCKEELISKLKKSFNTMIVQLNQSGQKKYMRKVMYGFQETMDFEMMMSENNGYLELAIRNASQPKPVVQDISQELRKAILELTDVYATERVNDDIEIHVKKGIGTYADDIPCLMSKYGLFHPYRVKTITNTSVKHMQKYQMKMECLSRIHSPMKETNIGEKLPLLTCAHVEQSPNKEEHDLLITYRGSILRKIGKSTRSLKVCSGIGDMPAIDIATVIINVINEDFEKHCVRKMKGDSGLNRSALEIVLWLRKTFAYKHGAKSELITDMFCSSVYTLFGTDGEAFHSSLLGEKEFVYKAVVSVFVSTKHPLNDFCKDYKETMKTPNTRANMEKGKMYHGRLIQHFLLGNKGAHLYTGNGRSNPNGRKNKATNKRARNPNKSAASDRKCKRIKLEEELLPSEKLQPHVVLCSQCRREILEDKVPPSHAIQPDALARNALARNASDKDFSYISNYIGSDLKILASFLLKENSTVITEQLTEEHRTCQLRNFHLLLEWRKQTNDQSLAHLFHLMLEVGTSVTIEWKFIAEKLKLQIEDIKACKKINKALDTSSRKRRQTIMGDLSSPSKKVMMTPTEKNIKNSSSKSSKKLCTSTIEPVPGPSGDKTVTSQTTDNGSIETEVSEEDLCCVCGKYTPDSLNLIFTLEFVKWAQCDKCNHWTHLKFCSGVRCLRRGDGFLCPHCQA